MTTSLDPTHQVQLERQTGFTLFEPTNREGNPAGIFRLDYSYIEDGIMIWIEAYRPEPHNLFDEDIRYHLKEHFAEKAIQEIILR